MKRKFLMFLTIFVTIVTIGSVNAKEINRAYVKADNELKYEDTVNGDAFLAGNLIDASGNINGIGFIAGNNVNVNGTLDYGVIAGSNINLEGTINKNVYIAGATIYFDDATIKQDTYIAGSNVTIDGKFKRNSSIFGDTVLIKKGTTFDGNINIESTNITIEQDVKINGTLTYNKDANISIDKDAVINKTVKKEIKEEKVDYTKSITSLMNLIVMFLVIALIIPKSIKKTNRLYENKKLKDYCKNLVIGFIILLGIPMISLMLLASSIGISLGLTLGALYCITLYLSTIFFGYIIGKLVLDKWFNISTNIYLEGIIGIIIVKGLSLLPVIGGLFGFITITIGTGTIGKLLMDEKDNKEKQIKDAKITKIKETKKSEK